MNLLLLNTSEFISASRVKLEGRRADHLVKTLRVSPGDSVRAGMQNGLIGQAKIHKVSDSGTVELEIEAPFSESPPEPIPCRLVTALPRPKMMRRVLQNAAAMGIKQIHIINCWKVEKSFWQTPWLDQSVLDENLLMGLEQAIDTHLPIVKTHRLFKPFVEDELPSLMAESVGLVAHPYATEKCPVGLTEPSTLMIGPEGGFTEYEVEKIVQAGAKSVDIGPRILRVETAIPAIISRLYPS